jgi:hypothetical protein
MVGSTGPMLTDRFVCANPAEWAYGSARRPSLAGSRALAQCLGYYNVRFGSRVGIHTLTTQQEFATL